MRMVRWAAALGAAALLATLLPQTAHAACHLAAFSQTTRRADESDARVRLTVVLQGGQPSCEGTVGYTTEDGTATAGDDYRRRSGELRFEAGDDREETITIRLLDDDEVEGNERFTVRLTSGSGNISPDPSRSEATVTIRDDDEAPPPEETEEPTPEETVESTPTATGTPVGGTDEGGGSSAPLIAAIVAALLALGAGAWWFSRARAG